MSEPSYAPQSHEKKLGSLWEGAPAWRGLAVTASFFTLAAVALPLLLPQPEAPHVAPQRMVQHVGMSAPRPVPPTIKPAVPMVAMPPAALQPAAPVHSAVARALAHPAVSPIPQAPAPVQTASLPPATPVGSATAPISNPTLAPTGQSNVCLMVMPPSPTGFGSGMVMSFEDRATSMARIQVTQAHAGGQIDPDYIDNQRVTVRLVDGEYRVFLVPKTMQVHAGDRVNGQGSYRNINLPCSYIPNLITADLGPAPENAASGLARPFSEPSPPPAR